MAVSVLQSSRVKAEGLRGTFDLNIDNADGLKQFVVHFIVCPNWECKKFLLAASLYNARRGDTSRLQRERVPQTTWRLIPEFEAKVFPDYVPTPILQDCKEACLIRDLSPKASATLSRRALQGMIRDFWAISKSRSVDEINAIEERLDSSVWDAIKSVKDIGNIGAHMEKDINTIIDVDANEAAQLIWLIETLIEDWYVARAQRAARLKDLADLAASKKSARDQDAKNSETARRVQATNQNED